MRRILLRFLCLVLTISALIPLSSGAQDQQFSEGQVVIVNQDGATLWLDPSTTAAALSDLPEGTKLRIVSGTPTSVEGYDWWNVSDDSIGLVGWILGDYLNSEETYIAPTTVPIPVTPTLASSTTDGEITIFAKDLVFEPTEIFIRAGREPSVIHMTNQGAATHHFTIDALGIDVVADPGETVDITIPADAPQGVYDFYCTVPGHKAAGMVGTLVIWSDPPLAASPEASSVVPGCQGFGEYVAQYYAATDATSAANPEADALFNVPVSADGSAHTVALDELTPEQLRLVAKLFSDAAQEMSQITPPEFARSWHLLQIQEGKLFGEYFAFAAGNGIAAANVEFDRRDQALLDQMDRVLHGDNSCPAFLAWAFAQQTGNT